MKTKETTKEKDGAPIEKEVPSPPQVTGTETVPEGSWSNQAQEAIKIGRDAASTALHISRELVVFAISSIAAIALVIYGIYLLFSGDSQGVIILGSIASGLGVQWGSKLGTQGSNGD